MDINKQNKKIHPEYIRPMPIVKKAPTDDPEEIKKMFEMDDFKTDDWVKPLEDDYDMDKPIEGEKWAVIIPDKQRTKLYKFLDKISIL